MFKFAAIFALAAVCLADDPYNAPGYKPAAYKDAYAEPKYVFDWAVKDDYSYNNYGQYEKRDGYNTDGNYWVALPDGRTQQVKYYVNGDSGYVAEVTYSGEPKYDNYKPAASYKSEAYAPAPYAPAPYAPAPYSPAPYKADPYKPAPYAPAPAYKPAYKPAPYAPAPAYKPASYAPAPAYKPAYKAPAYKAPAYPAPAY